MKEKIFPFIAPVIFGILVLLTATIVAGGLHLYEIFPYFDVLMHASAGFAVAWLFSKFLINDRVGRKNIFIILISFTIVVGTFWEYAEYLSSAFGPIYAPVFSKSFYIGTLKDTLGDIFADIIGAFVFCLVLYWRKKST